MEFAPVVLFTYNRLDHTRRTIESLLNNELSDKTDLIIFCDAAKKEEDIKKVDEVRNYLKTIKGFKRIEIIERLSNYGLAKSIITGVTEIINKFGKIIVLEDDMVTSRYFLSYMNKALNIYENETDVISIHGYVYPVKKKLPDTFFLKGADCWGWATWKRGWDLFEEDSKKLLKELKERKLEKEFNFNNTYPYIGMLEGQANGEIDSWAIRWYASAFLRNKLTLYPGETLVKNIGNDGSGTNCKKQKNFDVEIFDKEIVLKKQKIKIDINAYNQFARYFNKEFNNNMFIITKIIKKLFRIVFNNN